MKNKMGKRILALLLVSMMGVSAVACDDEDYEDYDEYDDEYEDDDDDLDKEVGTQGDRDQTWAIYWYLCGSDLESEAEAATLDLMEMMEVDLPDNVQIIIQTGGADSWQNDFVDADYTERFVYSSEGLEKVDQQPLANMGDPATLADFLTFCQENYPADKTGVIFWNHGGGSVSGAAFDENYEYDALTLSEFYEGFNMACELSPEDQPFEFVGFDACLMATIDTAYVFSDIAKYMVASEELEPGIGWSYTGWLQALADNPGMDGAMLGKEICDSYIEGCEEYWQEDEVTLSVVDLSKVQPLVEAYEAMGAEALTYALEDNSFFGDFGREAVSSENYGGNTRDQGYSNLVDLGHLAKNCEEILPEMSQTVLDCIDDCVTYKVNGPYRKHATGLSCYFSYNGDISDLEGYAQEGCSNTFSYLYSYGIEGEIPEEGIEYIDSLGYGEEYIEEVPDLEQSADEEFPLYVDEDGVVVMELEEDVVNMLKGVYFQLAYADEEEDIMLMLGQDNDIEGDWENGVFRDNFWGSWGAIDGYPVYMEVSYEAEDYTVYAVPVLLNGEEYNLRVIYDYNDEEFYILGARKGIDDTGMADKNLVQLQPGDEITTLHYAATMSGDDDFQMLPIDTFTVTEDTRFEQVDMGDGTYLLMFELVDAKNNSAYSEMVMYTVEGDNIDVEIME